MSAPSPPIGWILRLAWRDLAGSRNRLLLYFASIVLGIAALAAIQSFRHNVQDAVDGQARDLLGADVVATSRRAITPEAEAVLAAVPGDRAREWRMYSMVSFPESGESRLANVRGVDPAYPFYGAIETEPPEAGTTFRTRVQALVDESLMLQYDAEIGDPIRIGQTTFTIAGILRKVPGEMAAMSLFVGPRVYIPLAAIEETGLIQPGSLVRYRHTYRLDDPAEAEAVARRLDTALTPMGYETDTIARRSITTGRALGQVSAFLQLLSLTALLLGGIGVASGIQMHVRRRLATAAVLRCLGARQGDTFLVYLLQAAGLATAAAAAGAGLGRAIQIALPTMLHEFLPVTIDAAPVPGALLTAAAAGGIMTLLFALFPLLALRTVSPLGALRESALHESDVRIDPARAGVAALIGGLFTGFAILQTGSISQGLAFTGGLAFAFAVLAGAALLTMRTLKRLLPKSLPFTVRQGIGNLYRPNNRTVTMTLALGLGVFLVTSVYLVYASLMQQTELADRDHRPNLILFDIQPGDVDGVHRLIRDQGLAVEKEVPIVAMRLEAVRGRTVAALKQAPDPAIESWTLDWDYRCTYRNTLSPTERLIAGRWHPPRTAGGPIPVSVDSELARDMGIGVGDRLRFNVHGLSLDTTVASIRKVDWQKMTTNFFVVFPPGVLEEAPHFFAMVTRADTPAASAGLQREVIEHYPQVSIIDLSSILDAVEALLGKVRFVFRFMSLFTILTGVVVVCGSILTGNSERRRESILLRTLGSSRAQLRRIYLVEYLGLGALAAGLGIALAYAGAWALCRFVLEVSLAPSLPASALLASGTILLTALLGMGLSRGVLNHPPLQSLREEHLA